MHLDGVSEKVIQRSSIPVMTLWILEVLPPSMDGRAIWS